ncbi:MAG: DUF4258 domain-containing protein [Phycisphaerae bacterium]|nr:DUF4258 domain-containing protein [Phycisphaerae bacterium]
MGELFDQIRKAVAERRYLIGVHAANRLEERNIPDWQVVVGLPDGELVRERPHDKPNAAVEVSELLADGTPVTAVWSWLPRLQIAKLVTVYYLDR